MHLYPKKGGHFFCHFTFLSPLPLPLPPGERITLREN